MAFGATTYSRSAPSYYAEVAIGWYFLGDTYVDVYWNGANVYYGTAYTYNPYADIVYGDSFPGSDGNNYRLIDLEETDGPYYYSTPTVSTSYVGRYEYYSIQQEIVAQVTPPDTSVTTTWPSSNIAHNATSFLVGIADGSSDTTYRIKRGSSVLGSRKGNGNIVVTGEMPPLGDQLAYGLEALVTVEDGGDGIPESIDYKVLRRDPLIVEVDSPTDADYGLELFDASANKILSVTDTVAFISASTTISISNSSTSGTSNISLSGIRTVDYPVVAVNLSSPHSLRPSIPSNGTLRIDYNLVKPSASGSTTYTVQVFNIGN